MSERYKSEDKPEWKNVSKYPPPAGVKILLLTKYGTAIIGQYYDAGEFTHWCGLPKLSKEEKDALQNAKSKKESDRQHDWILDNPGAWR